MSSTAPTPTPSPSVVNGVVSNVVNQFKPLGPLTTSNWSQYLITAMGVIDSSFPTLAGADKKTLATAVILVLVNNSPGLTAAEKGVLDPVITASVGPMIDAIVEVSKGLSSINVSTTCSSWFSCCRRAK